MAASDPTARALYEERMEKITRYENFLNETLKKDLFSAMEARDRVYEEQAEYLKLKTISKFLK